MKEIYDLCDYYNVRLAFYDDNDIEEDGFFVMGHNILCVRKGLPENVVKKIVLHELGHRGHSPNSYHNNSVKHENEADRFMIRELLKEYIDLYGPDDFNWLRFAEAYDLNTVTNEVMIMEEFKRLLQNMQFPL